MADALVQLVREVVIRDVLDRVVEAGGLGQLFRDPRLIGEVERPVVLGETEGEQVRLEFLDEWPAVPELRVVRSEIRIPLLVDPCGLPQDQRTGGRPCVAGENADTCVQKKSGNRVVG
jgi:hypothetical protein